MTDQLTADPFISYVIDPALRADPYPLYEQLRTQDPVHLVESMNVWVLSSYEHIASVLRDPRFSTDERKSNHYVGFETKTFGRMFLAMLLFQDDPDHKRLRDLVQKAFTRRMVEDLRPRIARLVDGLIDDMLHRGSSDLIGDFAYPLPVTVICELLGVPPDDQEAFHALAPDIAVGFEIQPIRTPDDDQRAEDAMVQLVDYLDGLIETKRQAPGDDLLSSLVSVEDDGDRLSHDELLATCILILFAGHETTANLIGNGTHALLSEGEWDRLVAQPALIRPAVEEVLRFDSPVQIVQRIALDDVEVGGRTIEKGNVVGILLGAGNRDPEHFPAPDRLDITRDDDPLIAFGGGVHFCLGAPLARLEAQMAIGGLARRIPQLEPDGDAVRRSSFLIRGFASLPVRVN